MSDKRHMVLDLASGDLRLADPDEPALTSAGSPWDSTLLEVHRPADRPLEVLEVAPPEHVVLVHTSDPTPFEWWSGGGFKSGLLTPGQAIFIPAMASWSVRMPAKPGYIALSIDRRFVQCAAHELYASADRLDWGEAGPVFDPLISPLAFALRAEAESGYLGGRVYGESLSNALAVQLVRRFAGLRSRELPEGPSLPRHLLRRIVDHMWAHLGEEVSLKDLAAVAGLSPFHFARLFKRTTGLAPHQYMIQCRVQRARELMLAGDQGLAEIALASGFCDQSHLTAHFKRVYGITPRRFRRQAVDRALPAEPASPRPRRAAALAVP